MSLAGLKKQINKANQFLSEHVGAAEATKLDDEYSEMEKRIDLTNALVETLIDRTSEYLQPNAVTRAKMVAAGALSKVRGSSKAMPYPQTEGMLGEAMTQYGRDLGADSIFGRALIDTGDAYRQMADVKYAMEDSVKQNFLDPLTQLQNKDLKEVAHHRKKLQGRRLDYDCKKRNKYKDDDMYLAEEKLEESKKLAEAAMFNVLENDVEQISQLSALVDAQLDFHRQTTQILEQAQEQLRERVKEAADRPRRDHNPKAVLTARSPRSKSPVPDTPTPQHAPSTPSGIRNGTSPTAPSPALINQDPFSIGGGSDWGAAPPAYSQVATTPSGGPKGACCKALYDFDAENEGELSFREGQIITLISRIDENWFEGSLPNGQAGFFPVTYVQVVNPLP